MGVRPPSLAKSKAPESKRTSFVTTASGVLYSGICDSRVYLRRGLNQMPLCFGVEGGWRGACTYSSFLSFHSEPTRQILTMPVSISNINLHTFSTRSPNSDGRRTSNRSVWIPWMTWGLIACLAFSICSVSGQPGTPQQKVDEWCGQRFNTDRKSCNDLLKRWCDQTQANQGNDGGVRRPDICDAYTSAGGGSSPVQPLPLPQQVQSVPQQQVQASPAVSIGGPKAKKADPSLLSNVNDLFNKLAEGKRQLEQTVKAFSDPMRAAAASPLWPQRNKNSKSKGAVTELTQNDPSKYFHGDVDLTPLQANTLIAWAQAQENQPIFESSGRGRKKRKVGKPPAFELWSVNPVPYDFDRSVPSATRAIIKRAIKMWEDNTCRRWVENGSGVDRVQFVDGDGCSSFIGHAGGTQEISLHTPGCDIAGIAAHEIGHSMGFFHEQSRPDQSDNVKINYKNIRLLVSNNFVPMKAKDVDYYDEPYDFGSVMHYDGLTRGFTYNEEEHSIITLDPLYQNTIGQRIAPSFIDVKQINTAYCASSCGGLNPNGCLNGGYADPNSCRNCKCPTGFGGGKCETVAPSSLQGCGGIVQATKDPQFFTSPNYPRAFPQNGDCIWHIRAPDKNSRVYIEFVDTFAFPCEDTCASSYVEVKRGPTFDRTGYRLCCDVTPQGQPLISEGPLMIIMLHTYGDATSGFKIRYYSDAGTGTVVPPIVSPRPLATGKPNKPGSWTPGPSGPRQTFPTPPPGPSPTNPPGCQCGEWGAWTGCSQNCGGCGFIRRQRQCNNRNCYDVEKKHCNFQKCTDGANFIWNNNEFYLIFDGCCLGLLDNGGGTCTGLQSTFTQLIQSFLPTGRKRR